MIVQILLDVKKDVTNPTWGKTRKTTAAAAKAVLASLPGGDIASMPYNDADTVAMLTQQFNSDWKAVVRHVDCFDHHTNTFIAIRV